MAAPDISLYGTVLSGHTHRVELLLLMLGLPYRFVDAPAAVRQSAEFRRSLNPFGQIPVLKDGDLVLADSNAILVYLARKYGEGARWLPEDPVGAARVQRWLSIAAGEVKYGPGTARLITLWQEPGDPVLTRQIAEDLLRFMDAHLNGRSHLAADHATIADLACYSYVAHAPEGRISLEPYPEVRAWIARVEALPGFKPMPKSEIPTHAAEARVSESPFHPGELEAQARARGGSAGGGIRDFMTAQLRTFFQSLPFVAIASVDGGWPAATLLAGNPGFVAAPDPHTLRIVAELDVADPGHRSLVAGAAAGVLGIDLATHRRNRANGVIAAADARALVLDVRQSFGNCPQYIQTREVRSAPAGRKSMESLAQLDRAALEAISSADTLFIASAARLDEAEGGVDISHRGGWPGFIRIDGSTLTIPDFKGNRYFNTLGNLVSNPRAALLFVDFEQGDLLHLRGTTEIVWDGPEVRGSKGAERLWRVHVDRAWRRRGALPLRWAFRELASTAAAMSRRAD